eukprot:CAMPEP_0117450362 /NCGR_PEP_ID=MMETSP0759-20121206/8428_1 /TAXON_ID=63605 /ORGANISM="Percolomonas cosmopolitus, Strain WS" /LENGTH=104 /DNA_ID=CAMNT_0005242879 /DNA_START=67 /DNA_END=381 /DNA_ORIENTATION=+
MPPHHALRQFYPKPIKPLLSHYTRQFANPSGGVSKRQAKNKQARVTYPIYKAGKVHKFTVQGLVLKVRKGRKNAFQNVVIETKIGEDRQRMVVPVHSPYIKVQQ